MKKILLSTIVLTAFSLSIILFEVSCKKSANAQSSTTSQQQNKIIYFSNGPQQTYTIWKANYDGTDAQQINISLPAGIEIVANSLAISPDHKTVFFSVRPISTSNVINIYSCNIDGTNLRSAVSNAETPVAY